MGWHSWTTDDDVTLDCVPDLMNRRIWQERIRLGLTRQQVSETSRISVAKLKGLETSAIVPTLVVISVLSKAVGMDSQYILIGQRFIAIDEAALIDNYRNSTRENKLVIRKISAALEKQVDDGEKCA